MYSSWVKVSCPLPPMRPILDSDEDTDMLSTESAGDAGQTRNTEIKAELHRVLNSIQSCPRYGVYVCESFKDPRHFSLDDYWDEVSEEAMGLQGLHRLVGTGNLPLTTEACCRLHRLSRLLARLSQRIDRVVLAPADS
jgi:hypothetical protein